MGGSGGGAKGVTRRGFLGSLGAGAVTAAIVPPGTAAAAAPDVGVAGEKVKLALRVNGRSHRLLVEPRWSLLEVLRRQLSLTGTKPGCERGECGACTVLIDGTPRYACMTLALSVEGCEVTTVEGLMKGEELGPVQRAFVEEDGFQCGVLHLRAGHGRGRVAAREPRSHGR